MKERRGDHHLIDGYRKGDPSVTTAVGRWQRAAVLAAGGLDDDDVDDVVQTAQVQLWRYVGREEFRATGSFRSLAVRIALARRIDAIRRRRFHAALDQEIADGAAHPLESIESRERLEALRSALADLKTLCRLLIHGRFLENKSYDELSAATGKLPSTLRVSLHRCLDVLRSAFQVRYDSR